MKLFKWFPARAVWILPALAALIGPACSKAVNQPRQVAERFEEAISQGALEKLDTLMAWDEVAVNAYYVTRDFMRLQSDQQKIEILKGFKQRIREDYLPLARQNRYELKKVFISRWDSNAVFRVFFGDKMARGTAKSPNHEFTISITLDSGKKRWYITDLGDFLSLNVLQGDFNPDTFYLPEPILP